jgi:hypothetical protein
MDVRWMKSLREVSRMMDGYIERQTDRQTVYSNLIQQIKLIQLLDPVYFIILVFHKENNILKLSVTAFLSVEY